MAWTQQGGSGGGTVTHTGGALTSDLPIFGAGSGDIKVGSKSGNTNELASVNGSLTAGHLLTVDASGNIIDGGAVPTGDVTHTGALTLNLPVLGNGLGDIKIGTKSGDAFPLASVSGFLTPGNFLKSDATGNVVDAGDVLGEFGITIGDGTNTPGTGVKGYLVLPWNCTVTGWTLILDTADSVQIGLRYGSSLAGLANMVGGLPPSLTSAQSGSSTLLTGWTTSLTSGYIIEFSLSSVGTSCKRIQLFVSVKRY